jgi:hypothetical protein
LMGQNAADPITIARRCFEWVRDEIRHSRDHLLKPVPCRASEVLQSGSGYCYAKSHLLAALLRACGIPSGLCYQRLSRDDDGSSYCLHGFNGVLLPDFGWYRFDPRGNRDDIDARFEPPIERLAFRPARAGEADLPGVWAEPFPIVVQALRAHASADVLWDNLPDLPQATGPIAADAGVIDRAERSLLQDLDVALGQSSVRTRLEPFIARCFPKLAADTTAVMAWEHVPLEIYGGELPCEIQSSWVYILRAGVTTGAERHPNSRQRMMSLRGTGDLQTGEAGAWRSKLLVNEFSASLERRWISVPAGTWHQAVVPNEDWVVVSFHTVPPHELIEERPDAKDSTQTVQRKYFSNTADSHSNAP